MPVRHKMVALFLCLLWASASACSPSAEGETKKWTKNQTLVTEYSTTWPGFKTVLEADQTKAKGMWDEAAKLGDEKQKAEKMKATNAYQSEMLNKMGEIKSKGKTIDDTVKKLNKLKLKGGDKDKRSKVVKSITKDKAAVLDAMSKAAPKDRAEAMTILKAQASAMTSAWSKGNRTYSSLNKSKKKKTKKKTKDKKK